MMGFIALEWYTFISIRSHNYASYLSPSLFLVAGLSVSVLALWIAPRPPRWHCLSPTYRLPLWRRHLILWVSFLSLASLLFVELHGFFIEYPITPDIVPALQYYVQRWLAGETVYAPMPFDTWTVIPNYLPLMWMPYLVPELLQIDYRYFPVFLLLLSIAAWAYHLMQRDLPLLPILLTALAPIYLLFKIIELAPNDLAHNVELTPVAFYLFLALAIWRQNTTGIILTLLLCLLSRIALSFWLPLFLVILWVDKGFAYPFKIGLYLLAGIFFIYVLPFVIPNPDSFMDGAAYYNKVAEDIWTQPWHARDGIPIVLQEGTSFALYFFKQHPAEPLLGLAFAQKTHFIVSLLTAFGLLGLYFLLRHKIKVRRFSIIALKVYLLLFYLLMHTPFAYLFLLVIFFSFPILWISMDDQPKRSEASS